MIQVLFAYLYGLKRAAEHDTTTVGGVARVRIITLLIEKIERDTVGVLPGEQEHAWVERFVSETLLSGVVLRSKMLGKWENDNRWELECDKLDAELDVFTSITEFVVSHLCARSLRLPEEG